MQIGAGYDIPLSTDANNTICIISFCFFQPYFGQNPRSTETWNNTTVRAGVALNLDKEKNIQEATDIKADKQVSFSVDSPSNVPGDLRLTEISLETMCILTMDQVKYLTVVLLNKDQVKDFKEDQLEVLLQKNYQIVQKTNDCLL
jgi:hypothetical protein